MSSLFNVLVITSSGARRDDFVKVVHIFALAEFCYIFDFSVKYESVKVDSKHFIPAVDRRYLHAF